MWLVYIEQVTMWLVYLDMLYRAGYSVACLSGHVI